MIVRIWKSKATAEGAAKYQKHFEDNVMPELKGIAGFIEAYLLNRTTDNEVAIEVHTIWESLEAIEAFAKPDLNAAVVEPEAQAVLTDYDRTVSHFTARHYEA